MAKKTFLEFINESKSLSDSDKAIVLESWEAEKLAMASDMRDEFAIRFAKDKHQLVEGIEAMTQDIIKEEMQKVYTEKTLLAEDRKALRVKLNEFANFSNEVLAEEVQTQRDNQKAINESMKKFAEFQNRIITEEIADFRSEKQELIETRVKLLTEGKAKIQEAKRAFINRASKKAAMFVEAQTRKEFTELKSQIDEANKNMFGRKIFEAFSAEFTSKQANEHSIIRSLTESVKKKEDKLQTALLAVSMLNSEANDANERVRVMESKEQRSGIMTDLLKPLNRSQRSIMENLLEKTPNKKLNEQFNKYLDAVINGEKTTNRKTGGNKQQLVESRGDRANHVNSPVESEVSTDFDDELQNITKLAGFRS